MNCCNLCEYRSKTKKVLKDHLKKIHNFCSPCNIQFETKPKLFQHLKKMHKNEHFQCKDSNCLKEFFTKAQLTNHQNTHSEDKESLKHHKCDICEFRAIDKQVLKNHAQRVHTFCLLCKLQFDSKEKMFGHLKKIHKKNNI